MLTTLSSYTNMAFGYTLLACAALIAAYAQYYYLVNHVHALITLSLFPDIDVWEAATLWSADSVAALLDPLSLTVLHDLAFAVAVIVPLLKLTLFLAAVSAASAAWWPLDGVYNAATAPPAPFLLSNLAAYPMLAADIVSSYAMHTLVAATIAARSAADAPPPDAAWLALVGLAGGLATYLKWAAALYIVVATSWGTGVEFVAEMKRTYQEEFAASSGGPTRKNKAASNRRRINRRK